MVQASTQRLAGGIIVGLVVAIAGFADPKPAVPPPATTNCDAPEHRQFDFWVGRWEVTQAGKPVGHNAIEVDLKRCALFESWAGSSGSRGRSINFYDRLRRRWHQTWIDDGGEALQLDGRLVNGNMVLEGDTSAANAVVVHDRITWTPNADGTVRQHWEHRSGTAPAWETVFDGVYHRVK